MQCGSDIYPLFRKWLSKAPPEEMEVIKILFTNTSWTNTMEVESLLVYQSDSFLFLAADTIRSRSEHGAVMLRGEEIVVAPTNHHFLNGIGSQSSYPRRGTYFWNG